LSIEQQQELIPLSLGELLKQGREEKGWKLESLAQSIKVKPDVVAAIECGETDHIPTVYLKGYIRSYARKADIEKSVVESHLSQARGANPEIQTVFKKSAPRNPVDRWFKSTSYVLASAVIIALVWQFTTEAVRFSQGEPTLRPARTENDNSAVEKNTADGNGEGSSSKTESARPAGGKTHLRASIASLNVTRQQSNNSAPPPAESAWAAVSNRDATIRLNDSLPADQDALEISVSADTWVEIVDRDGHKVEMDLLRAGSKRDYSGNGPFRMLLGRASSVEVIHNGVKIDLAPHTRGNVARLTLGTEVDRSESEVTAESEPALQELKEPDQG
jgi:cytoskeleton protein RodZ